MKPEYVPPTEMGRQRQAWFKEHAKSGMAFEESAIEKEFGGPLEWQRLEGKRACRIKKAISRGGYRDDQSKWPDIQDVMIDAMIRLEKALKPFVAKLQV